MITKFASIGTLRIKCDGSYVIFVTNYVIFQFLRIWWIFMVRCLYTISVVAKRFLRIVKDVSKVVSNVWHRWTRFFLLLSELNVTTNTSVIQWRHICHTIHTINLSTDSGTEFFIYRNSKSKSSSKMTIFGRKKQSDQNQQKTLVRKKSEISDWIQNSKTSNRRIVYGPRFPVINFWAPEM